MNAITLSSKYQFVLPKTIRDELGLHAGQKFAVLAKGSIIELIPLGSIAESRGLLKGANPEGYRDRGNIYR
ncbi:MAG: AbrB/MazE/SpoVT family DNA-binding domain-containing protein [Candidatus Thiosymbion ectosymbiont of Robbea hypermnestra]|nr:AbrB/MazE/SpoVT family DNA-binding domain-containing protein [Candidatus Thiosymbion ectosymbiont of Robbea hypermnestra]